MKNIYKYVCCLLVYVIPFTSTVTPSEFSDGSQDLGNGMVSYEEGENIREKICRDHLMEVEGWDNASFDEVLKEVLPSLLFVNNRDIKRSIL